MFLKPRWGKRLAATTIAVNFETTVTLPARHEAAMPPMNRYRWDTPEYA
jgi:hypothetical protein